MVSCPHILLMQVTGTSNWCQNLGTIFAVSTISTGLLWRRFHQRLTYECTINVTMFLVVRHCNNKGLIVLQYHTSVCGQCFTEGLLFPLQWLQCRCHSITDCVSSWHSLGGLAMQQFADNCTAVFHLISQNIIFPVIIYHVYLLGNPTFMAIHYKNSNPTLLFLSRWSSSWIWDSISSLESFCS